MTVFAIAKVFAIILLASPLVLILVGALCTLIPPAAELLMNLFLSLLGEIPIFELAANAVQVLLDNRKLNADAFLASFMHILVNSMADALILSCCIFAVKASRVFFNRKFEGRFLTAQWRLTLIGVLIGVAVMKLKSILLPMAQSIFFLAVTAGLFLYGIGIMLGRPTFSRTYRNRRAGFMIPMMTDILSDMFTAMSAVLLITCTMVGPQCVAQGASFGAWLLCCGLSAAAMAVTSWLSGILGSVN